MSFTEDGNGADEGGSRSPDGEAGVPFRSGLSFQIHADPGNTDSQTSQLKKGEQYFEDWKVPQLLEALSSAILYERPPNPYHFLQQAMAKSLAIDGAGSKGAAGEEGRPWHAFVSQKRIKQIYKAGAGTQKMPKSKQKRRTINDEMKGSPMREMDIGGQRGKAGKAARKAREERMKRIKDAKARAPGRKSQAVNIPTPKAAPKISGAKSVVPGIPKGKKKKKRKPAAAPREGPPPTQDEAATTIQAAFKGYAVRKKMPSGGIHAPSHHTKDGKKVKSARPGGRNDDAPEGLTRNQCFIFLKPHAATKQCKAMVKDALTKAGITIVTKGKVEGDDIAAKNLVTKHYPYYGKHALKSTAEDIAKHVDNDLFEGRFGESWDEAVERGAVKNASQAMEDLAIDAGDLMSLFKDAEETKTMHRFGVGIILAKLLPEGADPVYVVNPYFPKMVESYHMPTAQIYYYIVEWDSTDLTWMAFLQDVIGATNPEKADPKSIRGLARIQWDELGLPEEPDTMDNVIHAAHSPMEAVANQCNWLGLSAGATSFGRALHAANVPKPQVIQWLDDHEAGLKEKDIVPKVDGLDCQACFDKCIEYLEHGFG